MIRGQNNDLVRRPNLILVRRLGYGWPERGEQNRPCNSMPSPSGLGDASVRLAA